MENQTEIFNPEMEIINLFHQLINRVDIDIEKSLKNHSQDQILADLDIKSRSTICLKPLQFRYSDSEEKIYLENHFNKSTLRLFLEKSIKSKVSEPCDLCEKKGLSEVVLNSTHFRLNVNRVYITCSSIDLNKLESLSKPY